MNTEQDDRDQAEYLRKWVAARDERRRKRKERMDHWLKHGRRERKQRREETE